MRKKRLVLFLALILAGCSLLPTVSWPQRSQLFYQEHQKELHQAALQALEQQSGDNIHIAGVSAIAFRSNPCVYVSFELDSAGLGPSTSYRGLYYAPDDVPLSTMGATVDLTADGDGWAWHDPLPGSDNHSYTRRIADGWYDWYESY